jgi:hypothetical protein
MWSVTSARVTTHVMPRSAAFSPARWKISLLAIVMASRTRSAGVPSGRARRWTMTDRAIPAATSPAAWPPTPSITP